MHEHAKLPIDPEETTDNETDFDHPTQAKIVRFPIERHRKETEHYRGILHHLVRYVAATNGVYLIALALLSSLTQFNQLLLSTLTIGLVVGTAIWVGLDARDRGADGVTATNWALGCLSLWLFAFPFYLARRTMSPKIYRAGLIG